MVMGTHIAMLVRTPNPSSSSLVVLLCLLQSIIISYCVEETDIENLLEFKYSLDNPLSLENWNVSVSPCQWDMANWIGVLCSKDQIWGLRLENMGLQGMVNIEILDGISTLRIVSLMNNDFEGSIPDVKKLSKLKALYLSNNRFAGDIPDDAFEGMRSLKNLFLANNGFTGKIPSSLAKLPRLLALKLEGNQFEGRIPNFRKTVKTANFANNELEGPIPPSFSNMTASMFTGNKNLCGPPLGECTSPPPSPSPISTPTPSPSPQPLYKKTMSNLQAALMTLSILLLFAITAIIIYILSRRNQRSGLSKDADIDDSTMLPTSNDREKNKVSETGGGGGGGGGGTSKRTSSEFGKLIFLKGEIDRFDLHDLLRASAEVLGSGNFGASYKAVIMNGEAMVVKRYKQMNNVGREDFHEHMRRLGRLDHENLLPLVAYYYRREEKLMVCNFVHDGSLASHLHGNHSLEKPSLDWPTRLNIIKGVAKGLTYLYVELPSLIVPHGHLKSSNVLLNEDFEPLLCDYALRPVINQETAHVCMTAYRSPEHAFHGRITRKTDVWCLGILILEVLSGKIPENYLTSSYDADTNLATLVNEMVKENRISEVFDVEMSGTKNSVGEMIKLLKIGLNCCEDDLETRPELKEVVQEIEGLKYRDEQDPSSTTDEVNAVISSTNNSINGSFSSR